MEGGGWRADGGGWRADGGGWRVEGGGWRATLSASMHARVSFINVCTIFIHQCMHKNSFIHHCTHRNSLIHQCMHKNTSFIQQCMHQNIPSSMDENGENAVDPARVDLVGL